MGYEITFAKSEDLNAPDNDAVWSACGWDKVDLFKALVSLGEEKSYACGDGRETAYGVVDVSALSFVCDIESRIRDDALWSRYRRLYDIDEVLADDWYVEMPVAARADMALSFFGDIDRSRYDVHEVARLLYGHSIEYPWFVCGLADALRKLEEEDVRRVFVFGE